MHSKCISSNMSNKKKIHSSNAPIKTDWVSVSVYGLKLSIWTLNAFQQRLNDKSKKYEMCVVNDNFFLFNIFFFDSNTAICACFMLCNFMLNAHQITRIHTIHLYISSRMNHFILFSFRLHPNFLLFTNNFSFFSR